MKTEIDLELLPEQLIAEFDDLALIRFITDLDSQVGCEVFTERLFQSLCRSLAEDLGTREVVKIVNEALDLDDD